MRPIWLLISIAVLMLLMVNCDAEKRIIPIDLPRSVISRILFSIGEFLGAEEAAYLFSSSTIFFALSLY